jgi:single-strand DNA-binding protein
MAARVSILGRLTQDADYREVSDKGGYLRFRIASSRSYTSRDGERKTDFFNVSKWVKSGSKLPEILSKGKQVYIDGTLENDNYEKEGERVYRDVIKAQDIQLTGSRGSTDAEASADGGGSGESTQETDDSALPF